MIPVMMRAIYMYKDTHACSSNAVHVTYVYTMHTCAPYAIAMHMHVTHPYKIFKGNS